MEHLISVFCKNNNKTFEVKEGSSLSEVFEISGVKLNDKPLCASVNNLVEHLSYRVYSSKEIEFFDYTCKTGINCYLRTLCFVLYKAINDIAPSAKLRIEHAISNGVFCMLSERVSDNTVKQISNRIAEIIEEDIPIERVKEPADRAIKVFAQHEHTDKIELLESTNALNAIYFKMDNLVDSFYCELAPSTGCLSKFRFDKYSYGYILTPPISKVPMQVGEIKMLKKLLNAYEEQTMFNKAVKLQNIGDMNRATQSGNAGLIIKVMEALHEKQIGKIAEDIAGRNRLDGSAKIILVAGPSSSGKTTFSKRLAVQLMTNIIVPHAISLDDYFVNRCNTPLDENGDYNYECIEALDLDGFNKDLNELLSGKEVSLPTYNFERGEREYLGKSLKLEGNDVLILEGIHALNPQLTSHIEGHLKYKIYVSALTSISIDNHNWIPTTSNRLLRRIIRDHKYRGKSAIDTIKGWNSVLKGEQTWIFPYQEEADVMFNSSLIFELPIISEQAIPLLKTIPRSEPFYNEAQRLIAFLEMFTPIAINDIPPTSLCREFLGGSSFIY